MKKAPIEIPSLTPEDFRSFLPPSMLYSELGDLFGHYSKGYLKQIISKMNSYTWFRFVEAESKSLIFKKIVTRMLYKTMNRADQANICAGNENAVIIGERAVGLSSRGVNYKIVNEDGIGIFEGDEELSLVVCDGVGDCLVGEVASYVILREFNDHPDKAIAQAFADSVDRLIMLGKSLAEDIPEFTTFPNEVSQAAVTAVKVKGNRCEIGQVGDVLFYHLRGDSLRMLDQNQKWLDVEQLRKMFGDEQYLAQRHIISNAVGRNYDPYWVPTYLDLEDGDLLILASDGLETLHPDDLFRLFNEETDLEPLLHRMYDAVIEANLKWNTPAAPIYTKPDNISMVLYRHKQVNE